VITKASSPSIPSTRYDFSAADGYRTTAGQRSRSSSFPAWLLLSGILLIPSTITIHLSGDGFKFTTGRAAITLLLVPALIKLSQRGRHLIFSDLFVFLTCAWMIGSRFQEDGLDTSAVAETIELMGGYIVSRAFFSGASALREFMRVFKIVMLIVILLGALDTLSGINVITSITKELTDHPDWTQYRGSFVRAQSTIEDAELYGTLCCVAGALFLYTEQTNVKKLMWTCFCFFGCLQALSSGPLMMFAIMLATFTYYIIFKGLSVRWKVYTVTMAMALIVVNFSSQHPVDWIVTHLTLDPSTGYFRMYAFDYAFSLIGQHPWVGWGFAPAGDDEFLSHMSVDSVWIVCALRFGNPMIILLFLANVGTFWPISRRKGQVPESYIDNSGTAFTCGIWSFMLIGLTVHYWNSIWMLWAVYMGIRGSVKESQIWPRTVTLIE
jgi:hypothetical protein